jgi:hypothetical protein
LVIEGDGSYSENSVPSRNNISLNTKDAIMNLHREYTTKRQDELHLHDITPASSEGSSYYSSEQDSAADPKSAI